MSFVFVLDTNEFSVDEHFYNVESYVTEYYKIIKKLIPLSYLRPIKVICDEKSACLFNDLPIMTIEIIENKNMLDHFEVDDILMNCNDITDTKDKLRDYIKIVYPQSWTSIINNLNTRFL